MYTNLNEPGEFLYGRCIQSKGVQVTWKIEGLLIPLNLSTKQIPHSKH